ncbi:MAG: nicotinamide mononucleotide transporter [Lachnospiraceae bacterium]|nr:nicotinamide mononucleotide transporter [Lachnospiraceae bacterium]
MEYFTKFERTIWCVSVIAIVASFFIFGGDGYLSMIASLVGVTSLLLCAKGNFWAHVFGIIFSLIYGYISFSYRYYGEMITYMCMTMPMGVFALVSWIKNPYKGKKTEVEIYNIGKKDIWQMIGLTLVVTVVFYYILSYFNTANLLPSTLSVTTSFAAVFLTYKRSPYYAIAYSFNDIILIVLWMMAGMEDKKYYSVVVCFVIFLVNDIYGFLNWKKMKNRQN